MRTAASRLQAVQGTEAGQRAAVLVGLALAAAVARSLSTGDFTENFIMSSVLRPVLVLLMPTRWPEACGVLLATVRGTYFLLMGVSAPSPKACHDEPVPAVSIQFHM
mmetsp:Transcript_10557/g.22682  ORF Transcript_10557/g.22682 Transcript_10557/m.22682 type:complete len:107 (-) Transcript_10557:28-348(-)